MKINCAVMGGLVVIIKRFKSYWRDNKVNRLLFLSQSIGITIVLPSFILMLYYGYSGGHLFIDNIPFVVYGIVFPISLLLAVPFFIIAFACLYARVFEKPLNRNMLIGGMFIFGVLVITVVLNGVLR